MLALFFCTQQYIKKQAQITDITIYNTLHSIEYAYRNLATAGMEPKKKTYCSRANIYFILYFSYL